MKNRQKRKKLMGTTKFPFSGVFNTTFSENLISETQKTKLLCFLFN